MILEQLVSQIRSALKSYTSKFSSYKDIPARRKRDFLKINKIVQIQNPIEICEKLDNYLEGLKIPLFDWVPFIDTNDFYWTIKNVLLRPEYLEVNLLKALLNEKEQTIIEYKERLSSGQHVDRSVENKISELAMELKLLRNENKYLYSTMVGLDAKISTLEKECKQNFNRATRAEEKLKSLQNRYDELALLKHDTNHDSFPLHQALIVKHEAEHPSKKRYSLG